MSFNFEEEKEVSIEDDIKRAWRRGLTARHISSRYGGSVKFICELCKNTKRKNDINKNNLLIIRDRSDKNKTRVNSEK